MKFTNGFWLLKEEITPIYAVEYAGHEIQGNTLTVYAVQNHIRNRGDYLSRKWEQDDLIRVRFDMPVRRIYANPAVRADAGRVALMRGPLVYCMEGTDNPGPLQSLRLPRDSRFGIHPAQDGVLKGNLILTAEGLRNVSGSELYSDTPPRQEPVTLTAVPYYAWGNRGLNQMLVWIPE